jgi:DNA helicase-2/ATP-dependent DNA helicase PcrA
MVPQLVQTPNEKSQSRWVIDTVVQLRRCGIRLGRIAVLFRASYHSFDLEIELNREGIAFIKVGGFKFMESAHVKDVLAHLRVLANPYDRISWLRILMLLDRIGPKTAQAAYDAVVRVGRGHEGLFAGKDRCIVRKELDGLRDLFHRLEAIPRSHPGELGTAVLAYYKPLAEKMYDDHPRRVRDLEQLTAIMERYESLESFLADMALEPPTAAADNHLTGEWRDPDRLTLSTVHSAKGLEWDAVFVLWALDGRFPSQYALEKEKDLEEELRLMYVAATRARERLYFLCPAYAFDRATGTVLNRPARFVADLPENLLERVYLEGMDGSSGFEMRW